MVVVDEIVLIQQRQKLVHFKFCAVKCPCPQNQLLFSIDIYASFALFWRNVYFSLKHYSVCLHLRAFICAILLRLTIPPPGFYFFFSHSDIFLLVPLRPFSCCMTQFKPCLSCSKFYRKSSLNNWKFPRSHGCKTSPDHHLFTSMFHSWNNVLGKIHCGWFLPNMSCAKHLQLGLISKKIKFQNYCGLFRCKFFSNLCHTAYSTYSSWREVTFSPVLHFHDSQIC